MEGGRAMHARERLHVTVARRPVVLHACVQKCLAWHAADAVGATGNANPWWWSWQVLDAKCVVARAARDVAPLPSRCCLLPPGGHWLHAPYAAQPAGAAMVHHRLVSERLPHATATLHSALLTSRA